MNSEINFIEKKIENTIEKYNMLKNVSAVILGVSGGADSMALLRFFESYSEKRKLNIFVAHVNHCLRGEESDRDENFVREYCKKNDINLEKDFCGTLREQQINCVKEDICNKFHI